MNVLLRRNVSKLGKIGEIVVVKDGYARNYLLPHGLATTPTKANLKQVESEKVVYLAGLARLRTQLEARAKLIEGKEFTIIARANEEGHLYGSIGPAQIAAAVHKEGLVVDEENIVLEEAIRKLDRYEIGLKFGDEVAAKIFLNVVPPKDVKEQIEQAEQAAGAAAPPEQPAEKTE